MRTFLVTLAALVLIPAWLRADEPRTEQPRTEQPRTKEIREIRGTVKTMDIEGNKIVVLVDGQERTLQCAPNCRVSTLITVSVPQRRLLRRTTTTQIQETIGTMNQVTEGAQVTLTTESQAGGGALVTQIRSQGIQSQSNFSDASPGRLRRR